MKLKYFLSSIISCSFEVNFGQTDPWYSPPPSFTYVGHVPLSQRVRGILPPAKKADSEVSPNIQRHCTY